MKDRIIESGAEPVVRPLWAKLTGHALATTDHELSQVIAGTLTAESVCIDIGAHKGLILDMCIRQAPRGRFYAFEPIPYLAGLLRRKYRWNSRVVLNELALSDKAGSTTFYINNSALGCSSLAGPDATSKSKDIETCEVRVARLDDLLLDSQPTFIKVDVEGAELGVFRGAREVLTRSRPTIVFEHAIESASRFNTTPEDVFDFFSGLGFQVSLMLRYLDDQKGFSRSEFCDQCYRELNANFIAYPI
jgi:FkbM family methyltransferase